MVPVVHCTLTILGCMHQFRSNRPIKVAIGCAVDIGDVEIIANVQFEPDTPEV
jgi:hypothetical protein